MLSACFAGTISPARGRGASERSRDAFLLFLLLIGFTIGVFALGYMGREPDADERVTLEAVGHPLTTMARRADLLYPPLYFGLLKIWVGVTGVSLPSLRIYSLIFALLALYLLYRCGVELFSRREGLWAALLLALSNFHLYYATEARMYSMLEAGGLILTLSFFRTFVGSGGRTWHFVLAVALLSLTHYFAWFFIFGQGLYFFLYARRKMGAAASWWTWAKGVLPFGILSLVLLLIVHRFYPQAWENLETLQDLGARSLSGAIYLFGAFHGMLPFPDTMRYGFLPWSLPFLALGWKWRRELAAALHLQRSTVAIGDLLVTPSGYLLFMLAIPIVGLTLVSLVLFPLFLPRYLIYSLPMYYLLVSRCAVLATSSTRGQLLLLLPAIGWSLASAFSYHLLRWFG